MKTVVFFVTFLLAAVVFFQCTYAWYDPSWQYRKVVNISNSGSSLTDYQVNVAADTSSLISAGRMKADCSDIRFVDSDDVTVLSYWIESGCNSTATIMWVKVPSIPTGNKTIYMYYGNPAATTASNGNTTFPFFDDFPGSAYDTAKWNAPSCGSISVSNSVASFLSTGGTNCYWSSISTFGQNYSVRMRVASNELGSASYLHQHGWGLTDGTRGPSMYDYTNANFQFEPYGGVATVDTGRAKDTSYHILEIQRNGSTSSNLILDGGMNATTTLTSTAYGAWFRDYNTAKTNIDWVLVRKYSYLGPTTFVVPNYTIKIYVNDQPSDTGSQLAKTCDCGSQPTCDCPLTCYHTALCSCAPGVTNYGKAETWDETT
jgi:hypothetical protein